LNGKTNTAIGITTSPSRTRRMRFELLSVVLGQQKSDIAWWMTLED
jgi:hypothetical protein